MKFTLFLACKEHLDTDLTLDQLDEAMTMAGLEIEEIENPAAKLEAFSTAYVKDAQPHPDADKLRICTVETKDGDQADRVRRAQCARRHDRDLRAAGRLHPRP
jgi:phenylalanyl-tRNA synthetase beta chain